jgi:hypothetical protein
MALSVLLKTAENVVYGTINLHASKGTAQPRTGDEGPEVV